MAVTKSLFGKSPEGKEISLYTLSNSKGMKAAVTDLGATLVRVLVPDAAGKADDLVLGFDNGESYYGNDSFFGTVIGPCANRTGGAEYTLDGVTYQLDKNDGANNLHTHKQLGFHKRLPHFRHPINC
jgi:aldose 1-epimerase